jgi:isopropylmalate/homocitrate/citramalate synthase
LFFNSLLGNRPDFCPAPHRDTHRPAGLRRASSFPAAFDAFARFRYRYRFTPGDTEAEAMARFDKRWGVLRRVASGSEAYPVVHVTEPNLLRETFPYDEVPRIEFDGMILPVQPAEEMLITDTTFRDGQQSRPPYRAKQIADLFDLLHRLSGPKGIIRQSEFFLYSDKDKRAVELCLERGYRFPEVTGWIRAKAEDFKLVKALGLRETGILTSVSDYHIFLKMKKNRKKALQEYVEIAALAIESGITPRCHFEDVTRADIHGFVLPLASALMRLREESGTDVKIRLCDTMGFGVTYPGAALPRSVDKLVRAMIDEAGVPGRLLEWHGHNDFHKVLANATTAWLYGCGAANGTLCGFGERTGNPPIEGLVMEYVGLRGSADGMDTRVVTEIARYMEDELGLAIPKSYPFIGANFNTTAAGIHIDGMAANEEIYNIFDTEKILGRPMGIMITDKSGKAGIVQWVNNHLRLTGERRLGKRHPGVARIEAWIHRQFEGGRVVGISDAEMERLARRYLPFYFISEFDRIKRRAEEVAEHLAEKLIDMPALGTMKRARMEPVLQGLLARNPMIRFAYVVDLEGRLATRVLTQAEDKALYDHAHLDRIDFSDRDWFKEPLQSGEIHVSDLFTSKITDRLSLTVSAPVVAGGGQVVGVLGLDIKFEDLAKLEEVEETDDGDDDE